MRGGLSGAFGALTALVAFRTGMSGDYVTMGAAVLALVCGAAAILLGGKAGPS